MNPCRSLNCSVSLLLLCVWQKFLSPTRSIHLARASFFRETPRGKTTFAIPSSLFSFVVESLSSWLFALLRPSLPLMLYTSHCARASVFLFRFLGPILFLSSQTPQVVLPRHRSQVGQSRRDVKPSRESGSFWANWCSFSWIFLCSLGLFLSGPEGWNSRLLRRKR